MSVRFVPVTGMPCEVLAAPKPGRTRKETKSAETSSQSPKLPKPRGVFPESPPPKAQVKLIPLNDHSEA